MKYNEILLELNTPVAIVMSLGLFLFVIKELAPAIMWVLSVLGIQTKWSLAKKEQKDLIRNHEEKLNRIEEAIGKIQEQSDENVKQSIRHDEQIKETLEKLEEFVVADRIENMRRTILDFASACGNGRKHTREQFTYVLKLYDDYEQFIEQKSLKNGEVQESILVIKDIYRECIAKGNFL